MLGSFGFGFGFGGASVASGPAPELYSFGVDWDDNSEAEGGFRIEKSLDDGATYTTAGTVGPNVETYVITGLPFNTICKARVFAFNEVGDSLVAGPIEFYTPPPEAPSNLTVTDEQVDEVSLSWALPSVEPVTGYRIYRSYGGSGYTLAGSVAPGVSVFTDTDVDQNVAYDYVVRGYNFDVDAGDSETADSNVAEAVTPIQYGWEAPVAISAGGDATVNTDGALVEAKEAGATTNRTVNGVLFTGATLISGFASSSTLTTYYSAGNVGADFEALLDSLNFRSGGTSTVVLSGLTAGRDYLVQFFTTDMRQAGRTTTFTLGAHVVTANQNPGSSVVCRFTATGTTQNVAITTNSTAVVSGYQVRDITML